MDDEQIEKIEEARLTEMLASEGWALARQRFYDYIETLESVMTLPDKDAMEIGVECKARARAIGLIRTWMGDLEAVSEAKHQQEDVAETKDYIVTSD